MKRSLCFTIIQERWNRNEIIINDAFAYAVATKISKENDDDWDIEPCTINECRQIMDWPKRKSAIKAELESLNKCGVFGPIAQTPKDVNPVGYE